MPLKAEDLKTVETYKKAIKNEVTKINPRGDTKFWVYKDVELPTASGGKQKIAAFIALVDDRPIRPLLKKQPECFGTCGLQDGKIAFEAEHGKVPYASLKTAVPLLLGKLMHVPSGADLENDEAATPPAAPPPPPPGPMNAQLNATWKLLQQQASQRMAANPAQRALLTKAMEGIPELLQGGKSAEAATRLKQLEAALKAAAEPANAAGAAPYPGLVKYRASLVQFAQAKSAVKGQIGALLSAIHSKYPHESALAKQMADELEELNGELADTVDEAMNAAENQASPVTDAVKLKIRKYLTELASNPVVRQVDSNPLGVNVSIAKTLGEALKRIQESMPA